MKIAQYILENKATVRDAGRAFGVSKSTVHKDVTERLPKINSATAEKVRIILADNKAQRHLRGGEATRKKYEEQSKNTK